MKRIINLIILVQVGSHLWVNPNNVTFVTPCVNFSGSQVVCILTTGGERTYLNETDWSLEQVLTALDRKPR